MGNLEEETGQHIIEHLAKSWITPQGLQVDDRGEVQYRAPIVRITRPVEIRRLKPRQNDPNDVTVMTLYNGVSTLESQVLLGLLGHICASPLSRSCEARGSRDTWLRPDTERSPTSTTWR